MPGAIVAGGARKKSPRHKKSRRSLSKHKKHRFVDTLQNKRRSPARKKRSHSRKKR